MFTRFFLFRQGIYCITDEIFKFMKNNLPQRVPFLCSCKQYLPTVWMLQQLISSPCSLIHISYKVIITQHDFFFYNARAPKGENISFNIHLLLKIITSFITDAILNYYEFDQMICRCLANKTGILALHRDFSTYRHCLASTLSQ